MTLYEELTAAGVRISNHESDLYFEASAEAIAILQKYPLQKSNATRFINQVEGGSWFDVPFAYDPWWEARIK
jgi:hypothetical protein